MKIIYIKNGNSSFIRLDEEILTGNFSTRVLYLNNRKGPVGYYFELVKLIIYLAFILPFHSLVYTRFADWHTAIIAWFCKLYRKKFLVVVGGYDANHFPEFKYGVYDRKTRGRWARYALQHAAIVLPNNPSLIEHINNYMPGISRKGGVRHFVPEMKGEIKVVFNGYHIDFWVPDPVKKLPNNIIAVAYVRNHRNYAMKGVNDFIRTARSMPDLFFKLVGTSTEKLEEWEETLPENLQVTNSLTQEDLLIEYQKASVFCLLSLSEGMPNVLCEAMLCGCVPVVSDINFNAQLIGDSGFVVHRQDPHEIEAAIRKAIQAGDEKGKMARDIIRENYPFDRREKDLVKIIRDLTDKA